MELLDRMLEVVPGDLTRFFFANSGSEAVENAIKIARGHTGKTNIICFDVRPPPPPPPPQPPPPGLACNDLMRFSSSILSHDSGDTEHIIAKEMVTSSIPASLTGAADPPPEAMFPPRSMQQRVQSVNLQGTCLSGPNRRCLQTGVPDSCAVPEKNKAAL